MKNCFEGQKGYRSSTSDCPINYEDINYTNKKTLITHYQVDKETGDIFIIIVSDVKFRQRRPREIL